MRLYRWYHSGAITLDDPGRGSGSGSRIHPAEQAAIADLVAEVNALQARRARVDSGDLYRERLAHHLGGERPVELVAIHGVHFTGHRGQPRFFVLLHDRSDREGLWLLDDEAGSSWWRSTDELRSYVAELRDEIATDPDAAGKFGQEVEAYEALLAHLPERPAP